MSKNRVIVEAVLAGQSHGSVARQYGVSTVWVGKLVARWRAGGWDALAKQSTRPKSNPNATSQEVIARVIALRQELNAAGLDSGPHTLRAHLQSSGLPTPSVTTIWRILTRAGLIVPEPRKRPKRSYLRFQADLPNECWQSDFTHYRLTGAAGSPQRARRRDHHLAPRPLPLRPARLGAPADHRRHRADHLPAGR
jgi:transposase